MISMTSRSYKALQASLIWTTLPLFLALFAPRGGLADTVMSTTSAGYPSSMAAYSSYQSMYPSYFSGSRGFGGYPSSYYGYPSSYLYGYGTPTYYLKEAGGSKTENVGQCVNLDRKQHKENAASLGISEDHKGKSALEFNENTPSILQHQARQAIVPPPAIPLLPLPTPLRTYSPPYGQFGLNDLMNHGLLLGGPAASAIPQAIMPVVFPWLNQATGSMLARQSYPGMMSNSGGMMQQQQQQQQQQMSSSGGYSSGMSPYYGGSSLGYRPAYYRSTSKSNLDSNPISNLFYEFANAIPSL